MLCSMVGSSHSGSFIQDNSKTVFSALQFENYQSYFSNKELLENPNISCDLEFNFSFATTKKTIQADLNCHVNKFSNSAFITLSQILPLLNDLPPPIQFS